jgi:hypothetical protein
MPNYLCEDRKIGFFRGFHRLHAAANRRRIRMVLLHRHPTNQT